MLIEGGVICLCHWSGTMCKWGFDVWGAIIWFLCGYPSIMSIWILAFGWFGRLSFFHFSRSGWIVFGVFRCLIIICSRMKFWFWLFPIHDFGVPLLWMRGDCGWLHHVWMSDNLLAGMEWAAHEQMKSCVGRASTEVCKRVGVGFGLWHRKPCW